jgi:hypothetical protein
VNDGFCKRCTIIAQDKRDEIMYENIPFVNDCANICEEIFCE